MAAEGEPSQRAEIVLDEALDALLGTACATRFGAFVLLRHLRWWLGEEVEFSDPIHSAEVVIARR